MIHDTALIATVAVGFGYALPLGFLAAKLRLPPLIGYLLAGILVGPFTPGVVADATLAPQLAEIGVILLMFGVGMHVSMRDLLAVWTVAVPGAVVQIGLVTAVGVGLAWAWGWSLGAGLVLGLALAVASTVVLLRALEAQGRLHAPEGRIAIGWLVVEDLLMVFALVMLPAVAPLLGGHPAGPDAPGLATTLGLSLARLAAFMVLMLVVGARLFPFLLEQVARTGSRELFTLSVLTAALEVAFAAAELFGLSFALGAFFAGVVIRGSPHGGRADAATRPLQDAFAALFFVSVGMLFDPSVLLRAPLRVAAVVAVIVLAKAAIGYAVLRLLRHRRGPSLTVAVGLAQIGEFSFILVGLGRELDLLGAEGMNLVLAGALLAIVANPFAFRLVRPWL